MSSANTWYYGNTVSAQSVTYYSGSNYKVAMYFSQVSSTNTSVTYRLHANVYFTEYTGWSSSSLSINGTSKVSGGNIYNSSGNGWGNGPWTKDVTVTRENSATNKSYSATANVGCGNSTVSLTISVPARPSYTISYNANNGTGAPGNQTKYYDRTLTLSTTQPTRSGYKFLGWSTSSTATTPTYTAGGRYTSNAAATLYAVWEPQASSIDSVTDVTLSDPGATVTVKWTPLIATFKFKVRFDVGGYQWTTPDYISPGNTDQYTFTDSNFNLNLANYIITATSTTATCYLATYDANGNQMGTTQSKTFTVTVPNTIVPVIDSISIAEGSPVSGFNRYAKTLSKAVITVKAHGTYSADISSVNVTVKDSTYTASKVVDEGTGNISYVATTNVFTAAEVNTVKVVVLDTRLVSVTNEQNSITVYDYYIPTGSIQIQTLGTTIRTIVTGNVAPVDNQNDFTLRITRTKSDDPSDTETVTFTPSSYSFTQEWVQTVQDASTATYIYTARITDEKNYWEGVQKTAIITISRLRGGRGVTLFGEAEHEKFCIVDASSGDHIEHQITSELYLYIANKIATGYDEKRYKLGEWCKHEGGVYEALVEISEPETWTSSHWEYIGDAT